MNSVSTYYNSNIGNGFTFNSANPFEKIDYQFIHPEATFKCKREKTYQTEASDHLPLYADYTFP
jgi:endonuclease/exonuclease/phosphatase family metal-dependent hydrolase